VKKEVKKEVKVEPEPEDMISSVKSRRLMSMQAKKEKEETDRQNKGRGHREVIGRYHELHVGVIGRYHELHVGVTGRCRASPTALTCSSSSERMEKGAEEERVRKQRASVEKAFQEGITKARLVTRRTPLGTDRNHNRSVPTISIHPPSSSSSSILFLHPSSSSFLLQCLLYALSTCLLCWVQILDFL